MNNPYEPFCYVTTVCTVDLLTFIRSAQARTVQPVCAMYSAFFFTRSSILSHISTPFSTKDTLIYVEFRGIMPMLFPYIPMQNYASNLLFPLVQAFARFKAKTAEQPCKRHPRIEMHARISLPIPAGVQNNLPRTVEITGRRMSE